MVELIALPGAKLLFNRSELVCKCLQFSNEKGIAHEDAVIEWVDGNIGSKLTMKYPAVILKGEGAYAEVILAYGERTTPRCWSKSSSSGFEYNLNILSQSISIWWKVVLQRPTQSIQKPRTVVQSWSDALRWMKTANQTPIQPWK